jgi:hypothetical protein
MLIFGVAIVQRLWSPRDWIATTIAVGYERQTGSYIRDANPIIKTSAEEFSDGPNTASIHT